MIFVYILLFIFSCFLLFWSGFWLVEALVKISKFLHWREFVVAFFVMAFACSLPNLFVGINSVINKVPQLSFGDIVGGNVINLTLVVGLAVLLGRGALTAESRMVQNSTIYAAFAAVLPLLLVLDGTLSRFDGVIMIAAFVVYTVWLFSKEDRFKKVYRDNKKETIGGFVSFFKDSFRVIISLIVLLIATAGIVKSSIEFSMILQIPLPIIGILVVGLGDTLPETYFSIVSARKSQNWMILGDIVGSVIYTSTLVLGIVVLLSPIKIVDFSPFFIARVFLVLSAFVFLLAVRTGRRVSKLEGLLFLLIYFVFVASEIFFAS